MSKLLKKKDLGPRFHTYPHFGSYGLVQLHYTEWGPQDASQTVLCVHGLTRNGRDFDFLARHLAQRGMRVIAPDLPGRGRSERLPGRIHYVTATYLSAMTALLCRLNVSEVDWVGTSLGGHIGMEFSALRDAPVRRLVLNDFGARVQGAALNRLGRYLRLGKSFGTRDEFEQHIRVIYQQFGNLTDEQWQHLSEHSAMRDDDGLFRHNYDPAISTDFMLWPSMLDITLWNVWESVRCPVLILRGETSDLLLASTVEQMKRRGVAAARGLVEAVEIADCGHAPALMAADQIRMVEEFLVREDSRTQLVRASA